MVAAMLTLPVAGTALNIADQHLHPRNLATALILVAISRILEGKQAVACSPLLVVALVLHPIMAALGISFCGFLALALLEPAPFRLRAIARSSGRRGAAGLDVCACLASWREALASRAYYFLYRWTWYEWLGALAPLFLFWLLSRVAQKHGETRLARFALAVFAYGAFQQIVAMVILAPDSLARLARCNPCAICNWFTSSWRWLRAG